MLTIIVLAAGLSRRMGIENKLLLPFQGKTIVETTIDNLLAAQIGEIIVVVGHESEKVKAVLQNYLLPKESGQVRIVENFDYEKGMTTSIQAGIRAAQNTHYMVCLSDMVLIRPDEYRFLATQFFDFLEHDPQTIVQPTFENQRGNPVIFSDFYKKDILETTDTEGGRSVVQKYKNHLKLVEMPTNSVLQDVDFMADYEQLMSRKQ